MVNKGMFLLLNKETFILRQLPRNRHLNYSIALNTPFTLEIIIEFV